MGGRSSSSPPAANRGAICAARPPVQPPDEDHPHGEIFQIETYQRETAALSEDWYRSLETDAGAASSSEIALFSRL